MRNRTGGAPLSRERICFGTGQQDCLVIGDQSGVFHGAECYGDRDAGLVELFVWVRKTKIVFERRNNFWRYLRTEGSFGGPAFRDQHTGRNAPLARFSAFDDIERPDGDRDQICWQGPGFSEVNLAKSVRPGGVGGHRCVRKRTLIFWNRQSKRKRDLIPGLIEAGKSSPSARRLELSHDVTVASVRLTEQTFDILELERAGEINIQAGLAGF